SVTGLEFRRVLFRAGMPARTSSSTAGGGAQNSSTLPTRSGLREVFRNPDLVGNVDEFCAPPPAVDDDVLDGIPCSAGHSACYISPYGDVYPCVQFPLPSGNVRRQKFLDIWRGSDELNEVRSI